MRIIEQSHQLLPDQEDLVQQIGHRARICYQSWGKETPESNKRLVHNCINLPHMSVLEMGRVTMRTNPCELFDESLGSSVNENNFLDYLRFLVFTIDEENECLYVSGSIRAFIEIWGGLNKQVQADLAYKYPDFFTYTGELEPSACSPFIDYSTNGPDYTKHKYQAVKLITNRAMTHEIVRHRPCSFLQESQRYVRYDHPEGIEFIRPYWVEKGNMEYAIWQRSCFNSELSYKAMRSQNCSPQQAREVLPNSTKTEIIVFASLAEWNHIFFMRTQGGADPMMKALMIPVLEEFRILYPGHFDTLKASKAGE